MKKIVGILSAAAVLATSVFAADVSAATKISGSLFGYDADKNVTLLNERDDSHEYAQPNMTFSASDEKAGATIKLTTHNYGGDNRGVLLREQTIWFKPLDALKLTVGNFDVALNKEQIDWTESVTGLGGNGFLATVDVNGITLDAGFEAHEGNWLSKKDGEDDPAIKAFFLKAGYSADFGSIGAYVKFNGAENKFKAAEDKADAATKAAGGDAAKIAKAIADYEADVLAAMNAPHTTIFQPKDGAISSTQFGVGYKNTFDPITLFVNFVGFMDDKFEWIRPELYVSGNVDALGFQLFAAPLIIVDSDVKDGLDAKDISPIFFEALAKVTYKIDEVTTYAYFKDANLLAKDFAATIKLGAQGNLGAMGWNIWAQIDAAEKTGFSVPVEFTFSF